MRLGVVALLQAVFAFGQSIVDPLKVPKEWQDLRSSRGEPKLDCSVSHIKPRLNYSFRFQTGYVAQIPARQFVGKKYRIAIIFKVTPENSDGEPAYFTHTARIPEIPPNNSVLEFGGGYVVGEGKYSVDWVLTDDSGRVCTNSWKIEAKLGRKERDVPPGMAAGTADEISLRKWTRGSKGASNEKGHRVTILMNAAPVLPRRIRLGAYDRVLLLSSLASLIERLPLRSVRLIVFNLDQQREVYRHEEFEPGEFGKVSQALSGLELGTVDYDVLKNRRGHVDLIADLIGESMKENESAAVVFVGPKPWHFEKVKRSELPQRSTDDPAFFYIQFRPFLIGATYPDMVMNAVKQMEGKTFDVYSPGDFAEAIKDITKALATSK